MSPSRDKWVLAATVVSESAWLFAVLGVVGVGFGLDGSPLRWPSLLVIGGSALLITRLMPSFVTALAVLSIGATAAGVIDSFIRWPILVVALGITSLVAYTRPIKEMSIEVTYLLRAVAGAGVVYLMVASSATQGEGGFEFGWMAEAMSDFAPPGYRVTTLLGIFIGMAMWWRGVSLATREFPIESLTFSFRLGVFALALTTSVDIVHPADLNTLPMIFIFFASGLGGLSMGHLLPESRESARARTWPKVIGGVVGAVLGVGLVFAFLQKDMLGHLSRPAVSMLDAVVNGVFWGLVIPISTVWTVFVEAVLGFFEAAFGGLVDSDATARLSENVEQRAAEAELAEEEGTMLTQVLLVIEWILIAVIALLVLYLLYRFLRQLLTRGPKDTVGQRESLKEDADLASDVTRLLLRLIPNWVPGRGGRRGFRIPEGPPGVVEALRVYYALLTAAEDRGYRRHHHQTPNEFRSTLERIFPTRLVRMATRSFIHACYGNRPASAEQIVEMQSSVKGLNTGTVGPSGAPGAQPGADLRST